mmetsp:Transcript_24074/g.48619  ORF Transcript_24074/g.48619 Transcript_24074/m.48619 type:complete len:127 (-) Transcript_24074:2448-2828(-)
MSHLNPKAYPLAQKDLAIQILDLIELAREYKQVKKGANESIKFLKKGAAELIVIAADADPIEIVLHLPLICEDKNIPYIFVHSKFALGKACGVSRSVIACCITASIDSKISGQIKNVRDKVENFIN